MTLHENPGLGLTLPQWEQIKAVAMMLSPQQALWLSGYFAGLAEAKREQIAEIAPNTAPAPFLEEVRAANTAARTLTILFGSETGNSAALARSIGEQARALGLSPAVTDMADYKPQRLKDEQDLLIVTSTYGEGDPPQPAADFFEFVEGRKAPQLPQLRYAVLALGDSTYERYCEAGKRVDRRFEELGATRLQPRIDCDVDYAEPAAAWITEALARLVRERNPGAQGPAVVLDSFAASEAKLQAIFDKRNPFHASIIENIVLTGRGSSKETRHIEFSLTGSGLAFEPGDALGVVPRNDPALVETILKSLALAATAPLVLKDQTTTLGEGLGSVFEITAATPRFLKHWAELTGASELTRLAREEDAEERSAFLRNHHVVDIIRRFPMPGIEPEIFVAGLRPLQPRLYSIASSPLVAPDEVHLTVAAVRYQLHGEIRAGVASVHLADRSTPSSTLPVYIQANPHFRLPGDDTPIIMIGAGTGVAPFRAFVQEREARGAAGRSWLFFGERNFRTDFLYQTEWQRFLKDGALTRMDVAFSRDRPQKTYVQHKMQDRACEIFAWLNEGAHVYVCGDAARLAPDVHAALIEIVAAQGGLGREGADDYVRRLQREGRYQRDVY